MQPRLKETFLTVIPVRGQMEKERSNSMQEASEQAKNKSEAINPRQFQIRDVAAKHGKRRLFQYAAPETTITNNSPQSGFLGAVDRSYQGKKSSLLKRLSECSLSPCSEEYKFVMQGFKDTGREPSSTVHVAASKRTRSRRISFNKFSQGSKYSSLRLPSELESALTFRPRPRGNTMPTRISDIRIAEEMKQSEKTNTAVQEHMSVHVKVASQSNEDLNWPVKKERTRHVSLSDLPQKPLSEDRQEIKSDRRSSEIFRSNREALCGRADRSGRKTPQRKKAEVELPKIAERIFIDQDHLQIKLKESEISYENRRKSFTAEQTQREKRLMEGEKFLVSHPQREQRYSSENLTAGKDATRVKGRLTYTSSVEPRPTTENSLTRRSIDVESKNFESNLIQASSRRRTRQFTITRANISHVGKAALVATRLLKIHYRENGARKVITKEEKELDKLFEEMKDCRYLRKSTSEMKI